MKASRRGFVRSNANVDRAAGSSPCWPAWFFTPRVSTISEHQVSLESPRLDVLKRCERLTVVIVGSGIAGPLMTFQRTTPSLSITKVARGSKALVLEERSERSSDATVRPVVRQQVVVVVLLLGEHLQCCIESHEIPKVTTSSLTKSCLSSRMAHSSAVHSPVKAFG